jgi:hypothetical protein
VAWRLILLSRSLPFFPSPPPPPHAPGVHPRARSSVRSFSAGSFQSAEKKYRPPFLSLPLRVAAEKIDFPALRSVGLRLASPFYFFRAACASTFHSAFHFSTVCFPRARTRPSSTSDSCCWKKVRLPPLLGFRLGEGDDRSVILKRLIMGRPSAALTLLILLTVHSHEQRQMLSSFSTISPSDCTLPSS